MLEALDVHARTNCQYLIAGDESWMMNGQTPSKMWALDRDHVDSIARPSHQSQTTMIPVFFSVNRIGFVKVLREGTRLTSEYFKVKFFQRSTRNRMTVGGWAVELM
jgi:hypothetical protein